MTERTLLLVTGFLLLAAVLIPVPWRARIVLYGVMLGLIVVVWVGASLGYLTPLPK